MLVNEDVENSLLVAPDGTVFRFMAYCFEFDIQTGSASDRIVSFQLFNLNAQTDQIWGVGSVKTRFRKVDEHLTDRELFEYRLSGKLPTDRFVDGKLIPSGERCG